MPTISRNRLAAAALSVGVLIAACGGGAATTPAPADPGLVITATEFAFAPSTITATAGQDLKITLKNGGTIEHDFTIDLLNVKVAVAIGGEASSTLTGLKAGTYEFYCSIAGHKESGMTGTLEVK